MKRLITILFCSALLAAFAAAPAAANESGARPFSLGFGLSYWRAKDLSDFDGSGLFGGSFIAEYQSPAPLALQLRIGGHGATATDDYFVPTVGWIENEATFVVLPIEAVLLANVRLADRLELFAGAGAGAYFFDGEYKVKQGPWRQTYDMKLRDRIGSFALLGARYSLAANVRVFLEAQYHFLNTRLKTPLPQDWLDDYFPEIPLETKIKLDGVSVQLGAQFSF